MTTSVPAFDYDEIVVTYCPMDGCDWRLEHDWGEFEKGPDGESPVRKACVAHWNAAHGTPK